MGSYCTAAYFNYANYPGIMLQSCCIAVWSPYCNHTRNILLQLCKLSCFHAAIILISCRNQLHCSITKIIINHLALYTASNPCCIHAAMQHICWFHAAAYTEFILESYCFHAGNHATFFDMPVMLPHPFQLIY